MAADARGWDPRQQRAKATGLAHHVGGLGEALVVQVGVQRELAGGLHGLMRLGEGGTIEGGEVGLLGVAGEQRGDHRVKPGGRLRAMAAFCWLARASGVSMAGGGSERQRVWMAW